MKTNEKIKLNMNQIAFPDITDKNDFVKKCMITTEWTRIIIRYVGDNISNTKIINEKILERAIADNKIVYVLHKPSGKIYRGIITLLEDSLGQFTLTLVMSEGNKNPDFYTINSDIASAFEVYLNEPNVCAAVK